MRGDPIGGLGVEVLHRAVVTARVVGVSGGDWIDQMLFDLTFAEIRFGDGAGDAATVTCAVIRHHVGFTDNPGRFDSHQFRVTRPQANTEQRSLFHSRSFAIALTAAAAIALPPRRPSTTR